MRESLDSLHIQPPTPHRDAHATSSERARSRARSLDARASFVFVVHRARSREGIDRRRALDRRIRARRAEAEIRFLHTRAIVRENARSETRPDRAIDATSRKGTIRSRGMPGGSKSARGVAKPEEDGDADKEEETLEKLEARVKDEKDEALMAELLAMEKIAFDPTNTLLNRGQFNELLDLQTETEPDFMQEIVDMYCDDSHTMLDELKGILTEAEKRTTSGYDAARATLHKLRGASSTLGAEGIQNVCESIREAIVSESVDAMVKGPGSLEELENRLNELKTFLKKYVCVARECTVRKLAR